MRPACRGNRAIWTFWTPLNGSTGLHVLIKVEGLVEIILRGGSSPLGRIPSVDICDQVLVEEGSTQGRSSVRWLTAESLYLNEPKKAIASAGEPKSAVIRSPLSYLTITSNRTIGPALVFGSYDSMNSIAASIVWQSVTRP